jgi:hypothetical protein
MRAILLILGVVVTVIGLLWVGQGLGLIDGNVSSFMLGSEQWPGHGSLVTIIGLALILLSRSIGDRS